METDVSVPPTVVRLPGGGQGKGAAAPIPWIPPPLLERYRREGEGPVAFPDEGLRWGRLSNYRVAAVSFSKSRRGCGFGPVYRVRGWDARLATANEGCCARTGRVTAGRGALRVWFGPDKYGMLSALCAKACSRPLKRAASDEDGRQRPTDSGPSPR